MESHADTTVLGCKCLILTYTDKEYEVSPYSDKFESTQHVPVVTGETAWTCLLSDEKIILVFNKSLCIGEKFDFSLVNPNQISHHFIDVQVNPCMHKLMGINLYKEDATITLYMSGTMFYTDTSSPTQQQLEDFPWIILTSQHDWKPHSICFPKVSHSKEEEYLFSGTAAIHVDTLRSNIHETEIETGLQNNVHDTSFIVMKLVSQVTIANAKVPDATRINYTDEEVFEGRRQDIPSHRNFTSKERHPDVNPYDLSKRW